MVSVVVGRVLCNLTRFCNLPSYFIKIQLSTPSVLIIRLWGNTQTTWRLSHMCLEWTSFIMVQPEHCVATCNPRACSVPTTASCISKLNPLHKPPIILLLLLLLLLSSSSSSVWLSLSIGYTHIFPFFSERLFLIVSLNAGLQAENRWRYHTYERGRRVYWHVGSKFGVFEVVY
jgi:hypothetical protein